MQGKKPKHPNLKTPKPYAKSQPTPKRKAKAQKQENIASTKHPKRNLHDEAPNAENKAKLAEKKHVRENKL